MWSAQAVGKVITILGQALPLVVLSQQESTCSEHVHALRRYRLVVDESLALGVLGARGRGACEAAGLHPGDAEIVAASLGVHFPRPSAHLPRSRCWTF